MKKVFFILFFLSLALFILLKPIKAQDYQDYSEVISNIEREPTCKIGSSCCTYPSLKLNLPKYETSNESGLSYETSNESGLSFDIKSILNLGSSVVNFVLDNTINRVTETFRNLIMKVFGVRRETYCITGEPSSPNPEGCICQEKANFFAGFCDNITREDERSECRDCINNKNGVWTAIGCISGDLSTVIKEKIFGLGVGFGGIVALLCIIYAAFQIQTSQGNPEKIKKGQELLTSCIMGLTLIIFSVFILKLIGVDILRIPGFGR